MSKEGYLLKNSIKDVVSKFLESSKNAETLVVSHFDTDGITSAAIMTRALKRLDRKFSVRILKRLEPDFIRNLEGNKIVLFLDLASSMLQELEASKASQVFIIDHHEIIHQVPAKVSIINPQLGDKEKISSAGLTYLFCREINSSNRDLVKLAVLGMIGDLMEESIDKLSPEFFTADLDYGEVKRKRGLLIYPSTRPVNKVLEWSSNPYIPGISGNPQGITEMLRQANIEPEGGKYKSIIELTDDEMSRLVTAVMLRKPATRSKEIVGDIFLLSFFNKLEDARELSAMVNACSRLDEPEVALQFCMEVLDARKKAEAIHVKYKQHIISGLEVIRNMKKDQGPGFLIINAQDQIKDTIIGTVTSILSNSSMYEEGTIITSMAYSEDKIKISARGVGRSGRNVREVLDAIVKKIGGEVGGHEFAAGCVISKDKEQEFIDALKKTCEIELVKI